MEIVPLENPDALRGAIQAHGCAWREAYDDLLPAAVLEGMTVEPSPSDVDQWRERLPDGPDDGGIAYGAEVEGAVRGYIHLRWENTKPFVREEEAGLKEIYIHPDYWDEGLGTQLLEAGIDALPARVDSLALEVLAANDLGRHFYEAKGFEVADHDQITIDAEPYETVIYRRTF